MTIQQQMMEAAKLRLRFRMNSRLRLESLATLSKLFREHHEPFPDELLSSIVFAVPEELSAEAEDNPKPTILAGIPPSGPGHPKPTPPKPPKPPSRRSPGKRSKP